MAYIEKTAFWPRVTNRVFDETLNITGKFQNGDKADETCSAGFLCVKDGRNQNCHTLPCFVPPYIAANRHCPVLAQADLVGSWVIISIDSLRSHSPLCLIYRLVHLAGDFILCKELRDICHILVERKTVIYLQSAIVLPLVRIADLDDEVLQLILSLCLGSSTHPCSLVDAL